MRAGAAMLVVMLGAVGSWPAPASAVERDHWEKTYTTTGRPAVHLRTDDGHVRVRAWDRRDVAVRVSTVGWAIGDRGVRIAERQSGDRVDLEAVTPRYEVHFGILVRSLTIEVWVPRETDVALESGDGDVKVAGVSGQVSVRSGDGRIVAEDVAGRISLRSGDGRIVGTSLDGSLEAGTADGAIHVEGRFDALTLSSVDGSLIAEVRSGSRLARDWSLTTTDGRLRLELPRDLRAELDAHTGDGAIDIDVPLTRSSVSRHDVHGALNGGGPPLRLRSGDGSVRVALR